MVLFEKYPKWLALNLFSAILFVIVNLGLPTILARMIDEGINPRDVDRLYFWGWVMFAIILLGIVGRIILSYAVGQLTTTMVRDMRNDLYAKLQEYSHHEYEQIGVSSLVTRIDFGCLCFDAVCGFYVEDGGHHTLDDGFQCSL